LAKRFPLLWSNFGNRSSLVKARGLVHDEKQLQGPLGLSVLFLRRY